MSKKPIFILNGPNLNRLGSREPTIYGKVSLAELEVHCNDEAGDQPIVFRQSNSESELIAWIHEATDNGIGIIINPAAYSFTSIAMLDALKMFPGPIIELHISNIHSERKSTIILSCPRLPPRSSPGWAQMDIELQSTR